MVGGLTLGNAALFSCPRVPASRLKPTQPRAPFYTLGRRASQQGAGGRPAGVDADRRLTFHVPGDCAEVHPGWGSW